MEISLEKWMVMLALAVVSIVLGLLPYYIIRFTKTSVPTESIKYQIVLTMLSCFGGGVLISTTALHMLPEVREGLEALPQVWENFDEHYPVAEMIMLCGFALIYLIEEIAHFIMVDGHHGHHHHHSTVARHNSIAHGIPIPNARGSVVHINEDNTLKVISIDRLEDGCTDSTKEECPDDENNFSSSLRSMLALIALSFHAIMEGVAIGIQNSSDVWLMFGAIASHKFVISFCMGMELVASQATMKTYVTSIVVFAIVSPLGILIGSSLTSDDASKNLVVTVIEGLACGTLLYVVFFEILNRERERKTYSMQSTKAIGFIQFFALAVGLISMGLLLSLAGHDHGSEEDDGHDHFSQKESVWNEQTALTQLLQPKTTVASLASKVLQLPMAFGR